MEKDYSEEVKKLSSEVRNLISTLGLIQGKISNLQLFIVLIFFFQVITMFTLEILHSPLWVIYMIYACVLCVQVALIWTFLETIKEYFKYTAIGDRLVDDMAIILDWSPFRQDQPNKGKEHWEKKVAEDYYIHKKLLRHYILRMKVICFCLLMLQLCMAVIPALIEYYANIENVFL